MATLYGVNATKMDVTEPSVKVNVNEQHGRLRVMYDSYEAAGALSLNDIIKVGKLPSGAKVYDAIIVHDDLGTTGTLDLGWAASADGSETADADGFLAAADVNAAAGKESMSVDQPTVAGYLKSFSAQVDVQINVSQATTAAGSIQVAIYYSVD